MIKQQEHIVYTHERTGDARSEREQQSHSSTHQTSPKQPLRGKYILQTFIHKYTIINNNNTNDKTTGTYCIYT